jgi:hypothetical protein
LSRQYPELANDMTLNLLDELKSQKPIEEEDENMADIFNIEIPKNED